MIRLPTRRGARHPFLARGLLFLALSLFLTACAMPPASRRSETLVHICGSGRTNLVIFIHGFTGDSEATWKNSETGASWPRLVCRDQPFAANTTVYSVQFDS